MPKKKPSRVKKAEGGYTYQDFEKFMKDRQKYYKDKEKQDLMEDFKRYMSREAPVEARNGGIMDVPVRQNKAGVKELDYRKKGGFVPPIGIKEKADDIPAMLSNNEFVFTSDAVRGMGNGDVDKGAEKLYIMMKKLENGGRV
jgi:hypothetical protein